MDMVKDERVNLQKVRSEKMFPEIFTKTFGTNIVQTRTVLFEVISGTMRKLEHITTQILSMKTMTIMRL